MGRCRECKVHFRCEEAQRIHLNALDTSQLSKYPRTCPALEEDTAGVCQAIQQRLATRNRPIRRMCLSRAGMQGSLQTEFSISDKGPWTLC